MKKNHIHYLICAGIALLHISVNIWWLKVDDRLPFCDPAAHYLEILGYSKIFLNFSWVSFCKLISVGFFWPPLTRLLCAPFINLFNLDIDGVILLMNIIFLPILVFSVFKIGRTLQNYKAGILAAFLVTMYPMMVGLTRHCNIDLALMAMIALSFYLLLKTDNFSSRKYSVIFGISAGLGLLTKHAFFIFMLPPALYMLFYSRNRESFKNVIISGVTCGIVAGPWYILSKAIHFQYFEKFFLYDMAFYPRTTGAVLGSDFYLVEFISRQASFIFFLIFLVCLLIFIFKYTHIKFKILLLFWIPVTYYMFTCPIFITACNPRFTIPLLIPISLIISIAVFCIRNTFFRRVTIFLITAYAFLQFAASTVEIPFLPSELTVHFFKREIPLFLQANPIELAFNTRPGKNTHEEKNIAKIFKRIEEEEKKYGTKDLSNILILSQSPPIEHMCLTYFCARNEINFSLDTIFDYKKLGYEDIHEMLMDKKYRYLIYCSFSERFEQLRSSDKVKNEVYQWIQVHPENYSAIHKELLSDGRNITVYKNLMPIGTILRRDSTGPLELYFQNGTVKIFYQNTEITEDRGLNMCFESQGNYYDSSRLDWQVEKPSSGRLIAKGTSPDLSFAQIWQFEILEDSRIDWQVNIEAEKKTKLKNINAEMFLSSDYRDWMSLFKKGRFPDIHSWPKNRKNVASSLIGSDYLGVRSVDRDEVMLPGILFRCVQGSVANRPLLENTDSRIGARVLGFRGHSPVIDLDIGKKQLFYGEINIFEKDEDMLARIKEMKKGLTIIAKGPLELYFQNGTVKVCYQNTEITEYHGLNMCFESQGSSYDSSTAMTWQIDILTPSKLIAKGFWLDSPITQIWKLELLDNNIIDWQIEMDLKEKIEIEAGPYVNLILSHNYQEWLTLNNRGRFPSIPPGQKEWNWVGQRSPSVCIGVKKSRKGENILPGVLLKNKEGLILDSTVPQNTNYLIRARALDVQRQNDGQESLILHAGRHVVFSGRIDIFEKDEDMIFSLSQSDNN